MLMTILGGGLFALICMVAALHLIAHSITTRLRAWPPPLSRPTATRSRKFL